MKAKVYGRAVVAGCLVAGLGALFGCGGGDTDGGPAGDQDFNGTVFVPSNVGSIVVDVLEDPISIGGTSGFFVNITDASGSPVRETRVTCDSEDGVAIIEPTRGSEFTDSNGRVSGVIGCEARGSYTFACRVPNGGGKRDLVTVRCSGDVPPGFDGFPGAGGGGLGGGNTGGSASSDGGSSGTVQITSVGFTDANQANTLTIDTTFGTCPGGEAEPFTDTSITIAVRNSSNQEVTLSGYRYSVPNVAGSRFVSDEIAFNNSATVIAAGSTNSLGAIFAQARAVSGNDKFFVGAASAIPDLGVRNVTVTVIGTDATGNSFEASSTVGVSFGSYDNCG